MRLFRLPGDKRIPYHSLTLEHVNAGNAVDKTVKQKRDGPTTDTFVCFDSGADVCTRIES